VDECDVVPGELAGPVPMSEHAIHAVPLGADDDLDARHLVRHVSRRQHPVRSDDRAGTRERNALTVVPDDADDELAERASVLEVPSVALRLVDRRG